MELPATIAAEASITRQNIALAVIKDSARRDQLIANIIEKSVQSVPGSGRGGSVDLFS